ncbi:MAG: class IV adenylate cyclase [Candidatus Aenigmarchaeota archaeon]|nr:class IV adenylate cyclase [Candidatus Aenigmarchaeota archaeon]
MIEVEVRARVDSLDDVRKILDNMGAKLVKSSTQVDKVFELDKFLDSEHRVLEGGIIARIRQDDGKTKVQFKEISRTDGAGMELSSEVGDISLAVEFLEKLDFKECFTSRKKRDKYSYDGFIICLDDVELLGTFIEVEKMVDSSDLKEKTKEDCIRLLEKIAPSLEIEKRKYGDLMQDIINGETN